VNQVEDTYRERFFYGILWKTYRMKDMSTSDMWESVDYLRGHGFSTEPLTLLTNKANFTFYGTTDRSHGIVVEAALLGTNQLRAEVVVHELFHWFTGFSHYTSEQHLPSLPREYWQKYITAEKFWEGFHGTDRESITKCVADWLVEAGHANRDRQNPVYIK
jgi:hypothetical protein